MYNMARAIQLSVLLLTAFGSCAALSATETNLAPEYIVLPGFFRAPETGFGGGLGLFILSPPAEGLQGSKGNAIKIGAIYTEKKQFVLRGLSETFVNDHHDHLSISGNAQRYPDSFFGIGNNTLVADEEKYTSYEWDLQLKYLHEFTSALYLGGQGAISRERITHLKPQGQLERKTDQNSRAVRGTEPVSLAGLGFIARWDTRDDLQDPDHGMFVEASFLSRKKELGSNYDFSSTNLDARGFVPVPLGQRPIRFAWQLAATSHEGQPPFQALASLGGRDLLRGYFLGRFRDRKLLALQTELRIPINEKWGAVTYTGAGNVARDWQRLTAGTFKPAWGLGGRYRISSTQKVNLRLDFAWGRETPNPSVYLSLAEAF